jgi:hypothetical protein
MNSAQNNGNGNGLNTAQHKRRGSLNISLAGGTPAQRSDQPAYAGSGARRVKRRGQRSTVPAG